MLKVLKTRVGKIMCVLAIGGTMLAVQVPSAFAFVRCFQTICSDDGTLCVTYEVSCGGVQAAQ